MKKTKKKVTWFSTDQEIVLVEMVDFDFLITKGKLAEDGNYEDFLAKQTEFRAEALADCNVAHLAVDDIIQFDCKGFFRVAWAFAYGKSAVLFQIPTGKSK